MSRFRHGLLGSLSFILLIKLGQAQSGNNIDQFTACGAITNFNQAFSAQVLLADDDGNSLNCQDSCLKQEGRRYAARFRDECYCNGEESGMQPQLALDPPPNPIFCDISCSDDSAKLCGGYANDTQVFSLYSYEDFNIVGGEPSTVGLAAGSLDSGIEKRQSPTRDGRCGIGYGTTCGIIRLRKMWSSQLIYKPEIIDLNHSENKREGALHKHFGNNKKVNEQFDYQLNSCALNIERLTYNHNHCPGHFKINHNSRIYLNASYNIISAFNDKTFGEWTHLQILTEPQAVMVLRQVEALIHRNLWRNFIWFYKIAHFVYNRKCIIKNESDFPKHNCFQLDWVKGVYYQHKENDVNWCQHFSSFTLNIHTSSIYTIANIKYKEPYIYFLTRGSIIILFFTSNKVAHIECKFQFRPILNRICGHTAYQYISAVVETDFIDWEKKHDVSSCSLQFDNFEEIHLAAIPTYKCCIKRSYNISINKNAQNKQCDYISYPYNQLAKFDKSCFSIFSFPILNIETIQWICRGKYKPCPNCNINTIHGFTPINVKHCIRSNSSTRIEVPTTRSTAATQATRSTRSSVSTSSRTPNPPSTGGTRSQTRLSTSSQSALTLWELSRIYFKYSTCLYEHSQCSFKFYESHIQVRHTNPIHGSLYKSYNFCTFHKDHNNTKFDEAAFNDRGIYLKAINYDYSASEKNIL
ncbi:hypothetical protein HJFPF1_07473 [Paramyrothecium foliicola]|nr:hypothetical protein HJFPF1_07473 [Paramyrothecium foliicola]